MKKLFERLGGESAVDVVVQTFYEKIMKDERISSYFDGVDMERQAKKQKAFLTMVFGGPSNYTGEDMRTAHKHLVRRGLNDSHFDAVVEILGASLEHHGVNKSDIAEVVTIANSVRNDVLGR